MSKAHEQAIKNALDTSDDIDTLFAKMGSAAHPRGAVVALYRSAVREIDQNLDNPAAVREILQSLRTRLIMAYTQLLNDAASAGASRGERDIIITDLAQAGTPDANPSGIVQSARAAIEAVVDSQIKQIYAQINMGADKAVIVGDEGRVGLLSPAVALREGRRLIAAVVNRSKNERLIAAATSGLGDIFGGIVLPSTSQLARVEVYKRQAIAAIDERTTDCCLRVNGQIVGLDEMFKLTGTPRFADKLTDPPFHDACRTSVALIHEDDVDDKLTREIREASQAEIKAREDGSRVEINPADARSRR